MLISTILTGLVLTLTACGDQSFQRVTTSTFPGNNILAGQNDVDFALAHVFHHGTNEYPTLHRKHDVYKQTPQDLEDTVRDGINHSPPFVARKTSMKIQRLSDRSHGYIDSLLNTARLTGQAVALPKTAWTLDDVPGPNVTDKATVLTMARAASNAYEPDPSSDKWEYVGGGFNYTDDFGWEKDGIRGHVFTDKNNETVLLGLKGTTVAVWDGSGTTTKDKYNDNLFFGCCCGEGSYWTKKPCMCATNTYTCNATCVRTALRNKDRYYHAAQHLYRNVTELYPNANVWLAGHSLGGAVASLLGMTYGLPVVTFEAPGEAMAASRLGLPTPPGYRTGDNEPGPSSSSFHFGHNADPLFLGTYDDLYIFVYIKLIAIHYHYRTHHFLNDDNMRHSRAILGLLGLFYASGRST
ncbi:MAG: hypothetical protein Q9159_007209 [Coniocarpon cinnabarinum]